MTTSSQQNHQQNLEFKLSFKSPAEPDFMIGDVLCILPNGERALYAEKTLAIANGDRVNVLVLQQVIPISVYNGKIHRNEPYKAR